MKKLSLLTLFFLSAYLLPAQSPIKDANAEKRSIPSFRGVEVGTGIHLVIIKGDSEDLAVSASKVEFRDNIVSKVENGILKLYYDPKLGAINTRKEPKKLKAYLSYKNLATLTATTGAEVEVNGVLTSPDLDMMVNTGAMVKGDVNIDALQVKQSTGSRVTLSGKASKMDVGGTTGSKFFGEQLSSADCTAEAGTGAQILITVQKELNARAHTGGYIKYKGEGGVKKLRTGTGGSVTKI